LGATTQEAEGELCDLLASVGISAAEIPTLAQFHAGAQLPNAAVTSWMSTMLITPSQFRS
jgi:hypothetical protein